MKTNMKALKFLSLLATIALILVFVSCDDSINNPQEGESILPERFTIDIPASIANSDASVSGRTAGRVDDEDLDGNDIYQMLSFFIAVGEGSGDLVQAIIGSITQLGIDRPLFISYESDEDGRTKNLEVVEDVSYEGKDYQYLLTITDADSEGNDDGGKAMQIFWNKSPISGVAIIKPYNINRVDDADAGEAIFKVEYTEDSEFGYDAHMIVSIDHLPLENPLVDPYSIETMKMFVGKSGDLVDVYGNSDHPNAKFFTEDVGFNWAFVASGSESAKIGVAEVGLPPNNLDASDRETLLVDYAIKSVFTQQIQSVWPNLEQELIDLYLYNTEAPGFFNNDGFIKGGTAPSAVYDPLVSRIQDLAPYNPSVISSLDISFQ
ncbi:MAG: hypothetical protein RLO17_05180 [Cyclobacteriaceae bacterium]